MKRKKLALLVGHNEEVKGAANGEHNEYDYNLDLARQICHTLVLSEDGIDAQIFERWPDFPKAQELAEVVGRVNKWEPDLTVELHLNSFGSQKACGTEILIAGNMRVQASLAAKSFDLPGKLLDGVTGVLGTRNRGVKIIQEGGDGWPIQSSLKGERLLLESFFLSNPFDLAAGLEKKEELAEVIAQVVTDYLGADNVD